MYRGTTPTYIFTAPEGLDLTEASNIFVTFSTMDEKEIMAKTGAELTVTDYVNTSSYGLLPNITYRYIITYSS